MCAAVLGGFIFINFYRKEVGGFVSELPVTEDPHQVSQKNFSFAISRIKDSFCTANLSDDS
jgi:hypothetical protein